MSFLTVQLTWNILTRINIVILSLSILYSSCGVAGAEDRASERRIIEEVFVTAQKREESIRDVPISLLALDSEFLSENGVTDFSELSNFVPNMKLQTDAGAGVDLNIRGFSKQAGNAAFDQAVGLLVDGVPYNDNDFFVTGMMDLARVEVLRGPQGTLLGKNTTAGLISITTARPTDEWNGYVDVQGGDFEHKRFEGAIGGSLITDRLNFRLAGLVDKRDGVVRNTTADTQEDARGFFPGIRKDLLTRDRTAARVKLELPNFFGSVLGFQYEYSEVSANGNGTEILSTNTNTANYLRRYDPNLDLIPGNYVNSINDPSFSDRIINKVIVSNEMAVGEWGIATTIGYANVKGLVATGDPTPAPIYGFQIFTEKPQFNIDIVATSPDLFGELLSLTAGIFYEQRELTTYSTLGLNIEPTLSIIAANNDSIPVGLAALPLPSTLSLDLVDQNDQESSSIDFYQETEAASLYGQASWNFTDQWKLITGLRLSSEEKQANWNRQFTSNSTVLFEQVLGYEAFVQVGERDEPAIQPKIAVNFKPSDQISLFVHWARGYRSGGFNQSASRNSGLEYDREVVDEYALNAKMRFLDGQLDLNVGWFRMDLDNFQLLTTGPDDVAPVAENAGSARAQGVELDFRWLATNWLSVAGAVGYNDSQFSDFKYGPCPRDRPNFDGDDDERCDLTGFALPSSPLWSTSLNFNVRFPLSRIAIFDGSAIGRLEFLTTVGMEYQTVAITGLPGDARYTQPEYARFNAGIGVSSDSWNFRVSGKNLTNEAVNRNVSNIPTTNSLVQSLEPPRSVYTQLRWYFN